MCLNFNGQSDPQFACVLLVCAIQWQTVVGVSCCLLSSYTDGIYLVTVHWVTGVRNLGNYLENNLPQDNHYKWSSLKFKCDLICHKCSEFDNVLTSNIFHDRNVPTQLNQQSEMKRSEDIFDRLSTYEKVISLRWPAVVGYVKYCVINGDLFRKSNRTASTEWVLYNKCGQHQLSRTYISTDIDDPFTATWSHIKHHKTQKYSLR